MELQEANKNAEELIKEEERERKKAERRRQKKKVQQVAIMLKLFLHCSLA